MPIRYFVINAKTSTMHIYGCCQQTKVRNVPIRLFDTPQELEVYEGMAKWSEIQYTYLIGEASTAKREEIITRMRQDEYGRGFVKYLSRYPLSEGTHLTGATPFEDIQKPL